MGNQTNIADAAQVGDFDAVLQLTEDCPDIDAPDQYGGTALMYAVAAHRADIVKTLMDHGADPGKRDKDGRSASDYALIWFCGSEIVNLLR